MAFDFVQGIHLHRTEENVDEIETLADRAGGRVGLEVVLQDLNRQARRSWFAFGRAVHRAFRWEWSDCVTPRWWPQGVTTSADADPSETYAGRRVLVMTWYSKEIDGVNKGSRLTFVDLDTLRYRHVLLVVPKIDDDGQLKLAPLKVHAGGIVWSGPYLHIAATSRGFMTARVDDILRIPDETGVADRFRLDVTDDELASYGYRYVLPVRFSYRGYAEEGMEKLRYSFIALDRASEPPQLLAGEYGRGEQSTRLVRFPLDPESHHLVSGEDGYARPLMLEDTDIVSMQGVCLVGDRYYVSASNGPVGLGSVYVGRPGRFRRFRWATPIGPEDITWVPSREEFWSVTEHPWRRWVFSMRRGWFDRRLDED